LVALTALSALSALLIAAVGVLLLLLAGLVLTPALLFATRVTLLLTAAFRIVLVLLILVRIGHDCYLSWRRATREFNGRKNQTFPGDFEFQRGTEFFGTRGGGTRAPARRFCGIDTRMTRNRRAERAAIFVCAEMAT